MWWSVVHCPAQTLILPHYAFQAQKFLTCLFSLDILVRMCASLALKNLTELRSKRGNCFIFSFAFHDISCKVHQPSTIACHRLGINSAPLFSLPYQQPKFPAFQKVLFPFPYSLSILSHKRLRKASIKNPTCVVFCVNP